MRKMTVVVKDDDIQIEKLELGPFGTNAYVLVCRQTKESVLVDAPAEAGKIMEGLADTKPRYILLTHSHMDHIGALTELRHSLKIPLAAHSADAANLPALPEIQLNDGDVIAFVDFKRDMIKSHDSGFALAINLGDILKTQHQLPHNERKESATLIWVARSAGYSVAKMAMSSARPTDRGKY